MRLAGKRPKKRGWALARMGLGFGARQGDGGGLSGRVQYRRSTLSISMKHLRSRQESSSSLTR